jgi:hypothetical protein
MKEMPDPEPSLVIGGALAPAVWVQVLPLSVLVHMPL